MSSPSDNVRSRDEKFASRIQTKITKEIPSKHNPYLTKAVRIHGYDHLDLLNNCEFSDVIFLLFKGELPNDSERKLFCKLLVALINPGPRHPATQASITAAVGKTITTNILPIALGIYGGTFDGSGGVEEAMRYYRHLSRLDMKDYVEITNSDKAIPGFGTLYGDIDSYANILLEQFIDIGNVTDCIIKLNEILKSKDIGILKTGLCAAVLADLGFQPRLGDCLMQLIAAPGLLAHGMEFSNKPLTSMLFESDDNYEIERD